jgi:NAD dependent epimerase/dehydratase family enzyme
MESMLFLLPACRWTPAIKKQIKESRLDITSKVAVNCIKTILAVSAAVAAGGLQPSRSR